MSAPFCGRCGAPLGGQPFCGRCGVAAGGAAPALVGGAAAAGSRRRLRDGLLYATGAVLIGGAAVGGTVAAHLLDATPVPPTCSFHCVVPVGTPLTDEATYRSTRWGYTVQYPNAFSVASSDQDGVSITFRGDRCDVRGQASGTADDQLVADAAAQLPSSQYQGVRPDFSVRGARVGYHDGAGRVYDASLVGGGATAQQLRIVVLAATHGALSIVVRCVVPADTSGRSFDGVSDPFVPEIVITELLWPDDPSP